VYKDGIWNALKAVEQWGRAKGVTERVNVLKYNGCMCKIPQLNPMNNERTHAGKEGDTGPLSEGG
jgi:hypothetical protein